jgi:acyl-homoserine lactone acylase PvdQ
MIRASERQATMRRKRGICVLTVGILVLASTNGLPARAPREVFRVSGVSEPVEIIKDRWGISHIYAKNYTVTATGNADNQTAGGSLKIIVDTENWDSSVGLNNPGQSGDPESPHYRDLFELWSRGKYFPLFYSRAKVESVSESVVTLQSATATSASAR